MEKNVPRANLPDVCRGALVEKVAHLLQLAPSRARIVQQVAQLRRIGLDLSIVLCEFGIALEHQHLMLWPTRLPRGVHGWLSRRVGVGGQRGHSRRGAIEEQRAGRLGARLEREGMRFSEILRPCAKIKGPGALAGGNVLVGVICSGSGEPTSTRAWMGMTWEMWSLISPAQLPSCMKSSSPKHWTHPPRTIHPNHHRTGATFPPLAGSQSLAVLKPCLHVPCLFPFPSCCAPHILSCAVFVRTHAALGKHTAVAGPLCLCLC